MAQLAAGGCDKHAGSGTATQTLALEGGRRGKLALAPPEVRTPNRLQGDHAPAVPIISVPSKCVNVSYRQHASRLQRSLLA